jgi:hypothetical protein
MKGSIDVDGDVEQVERNNAARFVISARLEATAKTLKTPIVLRDDFAPAYGKPLTRLATIRYVGLPAHTSSLRQRSVVSRYWLLVADQMHCARPPTFGYSTSDQLCGLGHVAA